MEKIWKLFVWSRPSGWKVVCSFLSVPTIISGLIKSLFSVGILLWVRIFKKPGFLGLLSFQAQPEPCPLLTPNSFLISRKRDAKFMVFQNAKAASRPEAVFPTGYNLGSSHCLVFRVMCIWNERQGPQQTCRRTHHVDSRAPATLAAQGPALPHVLPPFFFLTFYWSKTILC